MTFEIKVTHTAAEHSISQEYAPKTICKETPEDAAIVFQQEISPASVDLSRVVIRLSDLEEVKHEDRESGRTVVVKPAEVGERCARCKLPFQGTPGWQKTTAGLLCPDCTVAVCPDDAEPVGRGAVA